MTQGVIYLENSDTNLFETSTGALIYAYDADSYILVTYDGNSVFDEACTRADFTDRLSTQEDPREHPIGSYNITYPYCRTAIRYRMDDPRSDPQIAQLIPAAPIMQIRLFNDGCDLSPIVNVTGFIEPMPVSRCGANLYPAATASEFYLIVDTSEISLPSRFNFTLTNVLGVTKSFWIGFRAARDAPPSQTVIGH